MDYEIGRAGRSRRRRLPLGSCYIGDMAELFRFFFAAKFRHFRGGIWKTISPRSAWARRRLCRPPTSEYLATASISIDESIVKSATQGVSLGVGVRVIAGERTGYAHSDDLSPEKIRHAAQVAALIAAGPAKVEQTPLEEGRKRNLYPVSDCSERDRMFKSERVELAQRGRTSRAARAYDARVFQVQVTYADSLRQVLVATSDGVLNYDRCAPLARMSVFVLAKRSRRGSAAGALGRAADGIEPDFFQKERTPEYFAAGSGAGRPSYKLDVVEAPAGEQVVVSGPGWPGSAAP